MPSVSEKQARFMSAISHSPEFAKKVGVPQSVGKDFHSADKKQGKFKYSGGKKKHKSATAKEGIAKMYTNS